MSLIHIATRLDYQIDENPAIFMFSIMPALTDYQLLQQENLYVQPNVAFTWFNGIDNGSRGIRLTAGPGPFSIEYSASVQLTHVVEQTQSLDEIPFLELPVEVLPYLNPSRYCESDRLARFAMKTFGTVASGYNRVEAICDWVHTHIDYLPGSTNASSGACEVLLQRAGVCRDFAHLSIALCRALGIPARYVAAYAPGMELPADFHGVFEVYLAGRWYLFDATRMAPVGSFLRISTGRDAADASFATILGRARMTGMSISTYDSALADTPPNSSAISTASL